MGCKASQIKDDGAPIDSIASSLPPVPTNSWYARPFEEATKMSMSAFQAQHKGQSVFSTRLLPASKQQFDVNPNGPVQLSRQFVLGVDNIYGMGYFHNTALVIEHRWRTRVAFSPLIATRYERPFYNMYLGLKIFVNDVLVPDLCPFEGSLSGCTATIRAAEATTTWLCVPYILCGDPNNRVLSKHHVYKSTMYNFLSYMATQPVGSYEVRVDTVYGCAQENDFLTDFIATGSMQVTVLPESRGLIEPLIKVIKTMIDEDGPNPASHIDNAGGAGASVECPGCGYPKDVCCTVCGASVCGSPQCARAQVIGYPYGCRSHKAIV